MKLVRERLAIEQVVPFIQYQTARGDKATAYVCENYVCKEPVNEIGDLKKTLSKISRAK